MIKFNNKRDVDRHVSQMSQKLNEHEVKSDLKVHLSVLFSKIA